MSIYYVSLQGIIQSLYFGILCSNRYWETPCMKYIAGNLLSVCWQDHIMTKATTSQTKYFCRSMNKLIPWDWAYFIYIFIPFYIVFVDIWIQYIFVVLWKNLLLSFEQFLSIHFQTNWYRLFEHWFINLWKNEYQIDTDFLSIFFLSIFKQIDKSLQWSARW